jgi:methenyltetrahydromethanopterin cyclohydrolase
MTELFTMIVLAANIIVASAFAKFAPMVADVATAHEQYSDANTFEGRVVAKIQTRNARSAVLRDIGESTGAYWGSPLF